MAEKKRTHNIGITFHRPITEKAARAYLAGVVQVVDAFQVLSKAAWDKDHQPRIDRTTVRRK